MATSQTIYKFFFPSLDKRYFIRLVLLSLSCYLIFSYLLVPLRIQGHSMEPTYRDASYAFCWRPQYFLHDLKQFDIVTIRFSGRSTMLLKRVLALPGDTLEFRKGVLYVNGKQIAEPYVKFNSLWNLPPRRIKTDHVYVVGDNRGTAMSQHHFGQVAIDRIVGGVVF